MRRSHPPRQDALSPRLAPQQSPRASSAADDEEAEAAADQSELDSHTYPSATPSEMESEMSQQGAPRLHPMSDAAASKEADAAMLVPEQDVGVGNGEMTLAELQAIAGEDIVVPISERVKRVRRKAPAPAYVHLVDELQPHKKKKKKKQKMPLLNGHPPAREGSDPSVGPAAVAAAANGYSLVPSDEPHRGGFAAEANGHAGPAFAPADGHSGHSQGQD